VQHLKLPHYVDFQSELELLRRLRTSGGVASRPAPALAAEEEQEVAHERP
jgi:alpha-D-ribose 1-methylphosphonate 5-triphosphate synthase subunit PhnI